MKRILRKVASIIVATAMVAALGVSAMALEIPTSGVVGDNDPAEALEATITIKKELTAYNPETVDVYAPNITYSYTISGIDANKVITDSANVTATTKPGPDGATITSEIKWENTELIHASSDGVANTKEITITVPASAFTAAGVYRYEITETSTDKAPNGILDGSITATRYLDVYVRGPKSGETGYKIYGYVLFQVNDNIDGSSGATANTPADAVKTEGFVEVGDGSGTPEFTADSYYTYNVSVSKTLVNDITNENHEFPFKFAFTPATGVTGSFNLVTSEGTAPVAMSDDVETTIKHNASVKYTGIPCGTKVDIIETNDVEAASYKVTSTGATTNVTNLLLNYNETTGDTAVEINTTEVNKAGSLFEVTFTNTLELISPTGVALAILPFVILFTFGVGFLVAGTAKRKEDEA